MHSIARALELFPHRAEEIRRLYLRDERFRAICEDLSLAFSSLHRFENRPDANLRPEVDDFREVLRELEVELLEYLNSGDFG